jgi:hypothetical protein
MLSAKPLTVHVAIGAAAALEAATDQEAGARQAKP